MATVIDGLEDARPGGRNAALNAAAWTLGRWVAAGALDQVDVEDALYDAAPSTGCSMTTAIASAGPRYAAG
jgi:hypothetical protein